MAVDNFIKIGDVKGESKQKDFEEWIDVISWSWGGNQSSHGAGGGLGGGKVSMQDFSFTKKTDIASTKLWQKLATGDHYDKIEFKARKAGGTPFVYFELEFEHCFLTSIGTGGSGGDDMQMENISFTYKKYKVKYNQQSETGGLEVSDDTSYDLSTSEAA